MLQLSDVFGSEREGIPKMLENTDRTIGPKLQTSCRFWKKVWPVPPAVGVERVLGSQGSGRDHDADQEEVGDDLATSLISQHAFILQMNSMLSKGSVYTA